MNKRLTAIWTATLVLVLVLCVIDLMSGRTSISMGEIFEAIFCGGESDKALIIKELRLPRIITAILAGAALSLSGAQMQAVFRNPLADPHILGVSAGAGAGVATAVMLSASHSSLLDSGLAISSAAAVGAMGVSLVILLLSLKIRRSSEMLIIGVLAGFITSALTSVIAYQTDDSRLKTYWSWAAGSFGNSTWSSVEIMAVALVIGFVVALWQSKSLNLLLFGDEYAYAAGANVRLTRVVTMFGCCITTGAVTAFCGPVGFVGIIAPHIAKKISGQSSMRTVLPFSLFTGAAISLAGDLLTQIFPTPVPAGSTIALIGIPLILYFITRKQRVLS